MSNTMTVTSPQLAGVPIINGNSVLGAQDSLSQGAPFGSARDISSTNLIALTITKFGAPTADCTITLQLSIDGGTNYRDFKTYTNAQIVVANGASFVEQVKGTHARLLLNPGTMTGANGFNAFALI